LVPDTDEDEREQGRLATPRSLQIMSLRILLFMILGKVEAS
jgi:hypothetical protein